MSVIKRGNAFQARLEGSDGCLLTKTFRKKGDADAQDRKWKEQKRNGTLGSTSELNMTLNQYFEEWFKDVTEETPLELRSGWRKTQEQQYRDFVKPYLGEMRLQQIRPFHIMRVLNEMANRGKSASTRIHAFHLLRKMFGDAMESYQYVAFNPAIKKYKPELPFKEARYLNLNQFKRLLAYVIGKKYGLAIWFLFYTGVRVGELIALRWEDLDLHAGRFFIRRTFVRKTGRIRDYPKGRKQHNNPLPAELREMLIEVETQKSGNLVFTSRKGDLMSYRWYLNALKKYCKELRISLIGTHTLRHSTSELYTSHGASKEDIQTLFAHSSMSVTERYLHGKDEKLERVSNVIRLFPIGTDPKSTQIGNLAISQRSNEPGN